MSGKRERPKEAATMQDNHGNVVIPEIIITFVDGNNVEHLVKNGVKKSKKKNKKLKTSNKNATRLNSIRHRLLVITSNLTPFNKDIKNDIIKKIEELADGFEEYCFSSEESRKQLSDENINNEDEEQQKPIVTKASNIVAAFQRIDGKNTSSVFPILKHS